jgi:putative chitinase
MINTEKEKEKGKKIMSKIENMLKVVLKNEKLAKSFTEPLAQAMAKFNINTPKRMAAFIGQCMIESANFTRLEEGLYYTTPSRIESIFRAARGRGNELARNPEKLANVVYANRLGNGNEVSGDGWKYRGRGLIQLTGKTNYGIASKELELDLLGDPDQVNKDLYVACLTAAWFFSKNGCNELADGWQISNITKRVNGPAMLHNKERIGVSNTILKNLE